MCPVRTLKLHEVMNVKQRHDSTEGSRYTPVIRTALPKATNVVLYISFMDFHGGKTYFPYNRSIYKSKFGQFPRSSL